MHRPFHLVGLELNMSILSAALRGEPTGCTTDFRGDVVAVAKRYLAIGKVLDGEGGYTVWGKLVPAEDSLALGGVPIGLAHGARLVHNVLTGQLVRWSDVEFSETVDALQIRQEMERAYRTEWNLPETLVETS